jgi:hypothetical protein
MIEKPGGQFKARPHTRFLEYGPEMIFNCLDGNLQVAGNFGIRKPQRNASHDHFLSRC